ncbi:MAG: phage major tail protein, TP901-1 family [Alphaproteobacteria bacterium]|nr:phage major tail protein, TP901-1 family [Alphaproteobacteria bacterium]
MTAQRGRDLLLKIDSTGNGAYITVAGLRANTLSFNAEAVDASAQDSAGAWKELLAGAGLKSAQIKGQGIFKNAASDATIRQYFFNGTIVNWQIVIPAFGTLTGLFQITALDFSGRHDGEVTFDLSLVSAGQLSFA